MKIDKSWYIRPENIAEDKGAGGVVIRVENGQTLVAFAKEGDHEGLVLPKGHVDGNDSSEDTARREITEEIGISDLDLIIKLGVCERLNFEKDSWKTTTYFLFKTTQKDGIPTDPSHTQKVTWLNIDNLNEMLWPEQRELIQKNKDKIIRLTK